MTVNSLARRAVLKGVGLGLAGGFVAQSAAAVPADRFLVGTNSPAGTRAAKAAAFAVEDVLDFATLGRQVVVGRFSEDALRGLRLRPDIAYVEPDGLMHAVTIDVTDSTSEYYLPWGVDRVDAEKVHAAATGTGVHVAVIDTGIDDDHPDLVANLGEGWNFVLDSPAWDDNNGHGTHCAGTVGAVLNGVGVAGVAPTVTLHAAKVLNSSGSGTWSNIAKGINWVASKGYRIGSLSLGGESYSRTLDDACRNAYNSGVLLVAAAGNNGKNLDQTPFYPASFPTVVAVSATNKSDVLATWSNYGTDIEFAAPGVAIWSTYPPSLDTNDGTQDGYKRMAGTSMACPHVSGAAALVWALAPSMTNAQVRDHLAATAEDLGAAGRDSKYGYGLVDAERAVRAVGDVTAPTVPTGLSSPAKTDTTVDLQWNASSDDVGVHSYNVFVDGTKKAESATTATTVTGLSHLTQYEFRVSAVDAAGNESLRSDPLLVTTAGKTKGSRPAKSAAK